MKINLITPSTSVFIGLFAFNIVSTHASPPIIDKTDIVPVPHNIVKNRQINLLGYEQRNEKDEYETVLFMPLYPAYGMISFKSAHCNADISGYIDPFVLRDKKLVIRHKLCKVSFDITDAGLTNPRETQECENYHPKDCNFTSIPKLSKIQFQITN